MAKVKLYNLSESSQNELKADIQGIYQKFDKYSEGQEGIKPKGMHYSATSFHFFKEIDIMLDSPERNFDLIFELYKKFEQQLNDKYTYEGWEAKNKERDLIKYTLLSKIENSFPKKLNEEEKKLYEEVSSLKEAKFIELAHRLGDKEAIKKANELDPEGTKYQDIKINKRTCKEYFAEIAQNIKDFTNYIGKVFVFNKKEESNQNKSEIKAPPIPSFPPEEDKYLQQVIANQNKSEIKAPPIPSFPPVQEEEQSKNYEKLLEDLAPTPKIPVITEAEKQPLLSDPMNSATKRIMAEKTGNTEVNSRT